VIGGGDKDALFCEFPSIISEEDECACSSPSLKEGEVEAEEEAVEGVEEVDDDDNDEESAENPPSSACMSIALPDTDKHQHTK